MVDILKSLISIKSILLLNEISTIFTFLFLYPATANFNAALKQWNIHITAKKKKEIIFLELCDSQNKLLR